MARREPPPAVQLSLEGFDGPEAAQAVPPIWRHPRANRECVLGDCLVAFEFQRGRRRTIGLSVGPQGLSVRAPRWTPLSEVDGFVRSKADWVLQKLWLVQERQRQGPRALEWREGADVPYLGRAVVLQIDPAHGFVGTGAVLQGDALVVGLAHDAGAERLRDVVQAWLMREAQRVFTERLNHFAPRLGVMYTRLRLSSAGTRWGSASVDGGIRLNWRLIHLSLDMIDYVVVHELSHLREMNHGPDFWGVVGSVMPDFAERRQALRRVQLAGH